MRVLNDEAGQQRVVVIDRAIVDGVVALVATDNAGMVEATAKTAGEPSDTSRWRELVTQAGRSSSARTKRAL